MTTIRGILLLVLIVFGLSGCASKQLHVRGELDQRNWVIRDFKSNQSYRIIMASGQAFEYFNSLKRLGFGTQWNESHIMEFDAYTMPPKMPWEKYETVGIRGDMHIERKVPHDK